MLFPCLAIFWLPFAVAIPSTSSDLKVTGATQSQLDNISLLLYTGETIDQYTTVLIGNASDLLAQIDVNKPTVFYIFGWTEDPNSLSVETVLGAYLKRKDHNVILVNWEEIAALPYPNAATSASSVGRTIANALNNLVSGGLDPSTLHVVSHSLGSQIAGFVGRNVTFNLARITGLDPAGPGFYFLIEDLTSNDAEFVDVIHTDAGFYGTAWSGVSVNFYPNGGRRRQPGCPLVGEFCHHHRSWYYYAESLLDEAAFVGLECDSYVSFRRGFCSEDKTVVMGYATPSAAHGDFYLQTNSESPFGRGAEGIVYVR